MSGAEARLEILTRINRATAGAQAPDVPAYPRAEAQPREEVLHTFRDRIEDYRAGFVRVGPEGVQDAVLAALAGARRVVVPGGLDATWLPDGLDPLRDEPPLTHAQLDGADAVVTGCAVAIARTGTVILDHGPGQGRRALTLVPDIHVCVIHADQVVPDVHDGVQAVAAAVRAGRPLTWLSGGSATSDIELVRVEGVHGPRTLRVIVVDGAGP
ncbi:L-lactate dehydrogenase complex protein LldG [Deinococcus metalli]|uniref:L-lactate dehydrogenase complex protein LldG n=1 Tax=Deinococcus metalli TaxID=1141878 RepID=A0A7W8KD47_9DEIO|nr:lactate utilization protein C [Deinococcus metalli]MBB5375750.1 L-lactate dehydrogenase complex protein LldG [Deinococcus metalli]GHF37341.1 lactate utilization protein C [Deinococcus metalli]